MRMRILLAVAVATLAAAARAQPVYESKDRAGPVFSDQPTPGAREVDLPPLNIMDPVAAPPALPQPSPAATAYREFVVVEPADGGTVHTNTGQFTVRWRLDPALQSGQGDAIAVRLDGTLLPTTRTSSEFDISTDEWQLAAVDSVEHQLQLSVVDRSGQVRIVAPVVSFYVHRAFRR
ncbi:hypothetical protein [Accumulibacter sp.]|uniref:hypothetical protein n=1 Tax=Accumulibacter sp. TaxID=2053492 RepID=UPI0025E2048E|nr:hypothetical protein [Accumulibacter sp.]MCM8596198.1 hypothetical protein [Accumulibacter sp.]MCM8626643.1 hypothetical protein [Accumulibacter sp.]MDS4050347.1 hypothetical protein [Accumulibacter sp.]